MESVRTGQQESVFIAKVRATYANGLSYLQFLALLQWVAEMRGTTYAECVAAIAKSKDIVKMKVRQFFQNIGQCRSRGYITEYEFLDVCYKLRLFVPDKLGRTDVLLFFLYDGYSRHIDLQLFLLLLRRVSQMSGVSLPELHMLIATHVDTQKALAG